MIGQIQVIGFEGRGCCSVFSSVFKDEIIELCNEVDPSCHGTSWRVQDTANKVN